MRHDCSGVRQNRGNTRMQMKVLVRLLLASLLVSSLENCYSLTPSKRPFEKTTPRRRYTSCALGRFGWDCAGICACDLAAFDCDDGPDGTGECTCAIGMERECGLGNAPLKEPRRGLLPPFLASFELSAHTLRDMRVDPLTFRRVRQVYNATVSRIRPKPFKAPNLELCAIDRMVAKDLQLNIVINLKVCAHLLVLNSCKL